MSRNDRQGELEWAFNAVTMCVCVWVDDKETKERICKDLSRLRDEAMAAVGAKHE